MNITEISIKTHKNLLAFSAGIDSTALFFLLLDNNIPFDIAIVDYAQRDQAKNEIIYATQLAHKYGKRCFISTFPEDGKFNEKSARDFRYKYFEEIILKENYEALLTAHQLNDKLEWFLMQFTKGAGVVELIGLEEKSFQNGYQIFRPLLQYTKEQLQNYLDKNKIKYFIDHTNYDEDIKRNYFRHNFSDKLLKDYQKGIANSFEYLQNDIDSLMLTVTKESIKELNIYTYNGDMNIAQRVIDKDLKQRGIIISKATRDEIIEKKQLVVSHKICVAVTRDKIYIAPFTQVSMKKEFKEKCRINKIPSNIRSYLYSIDFKF
jgi:tRNA(Ile)-lysidine synthase